MDDRASKGGKARAAKLTPEERSESARNAVRARWSRRAPKPHAPRICTATTATTVPCFSLTVCY